MRLLLKWHHPLALKDDKRNNAVYVVDVELIPERPGIYIFYRTFSSHKSALYVGKAMDLKMRVNQQMNNVRLMMGVKNATMGARHLVIGELMHGGAGIDTKLKLIERTLIRHFQQSTGELVNVQGNRIVEHELTSERRALKDFIPHTLFFER